MAGTAGAAVIWVLGTFLIGFAGRPVLTSLLAAEGFVVGFLVAAALQLLRESAAPVIGDPSQIDAVSLGAAQGKRLRPDPAPDNPWGREDSFQWLLDNAHDIIVVIDDTGVVRYQSRSVETALGCGPGQMIGRPMLEFLHPDDRDRAYQLLHQASQPRGRTRYVVARHRHGNGTWRVLESIGTSYRTSTGDLLGVINSRDITDRREMQERLIRSEASYRNLFEHANYGIYRSTPDGTLLAVNPALVRMMGYESMYELLAVDMTAVYVDPDLRQTYVEQYSDVENIDGVEAQWLRKDRSVITVRLCGRPVLSECGELQYFEMFVENVTERRALEAQLRHAQKMQAIGQLAGGIAHDFNNVLSVILANAQLLADALEAMDSPLLPDVQEIERAAQQAATVTARLLGFGRKAPLKMAPVDLGGVVSGLSSMLRRVLPASIDIRIVAPERCVVHADVSAVEQILLNLATNARDSMPDGGVLQIEVSEQILTGTHPAAPSPIEPGPYVRVAVSDSGTGMDGETLGRVFEPFYTTKPPGSGSGLGMPMVYGLTEQHGGFVHVASELQQGTAVTLYFPAVRKEPTTAVAIAQPQAGARNGRETILLVEDEDALRRVGQRVLEKFGHTVLLAADGEEALEVYAQHEAEIDLVLSDLVMPRMGGKRLYDTLQSNGSTVKFLFATGYAGKEVRERDEIDPSVPVLQKPWKVEELLQCVRGVLDEQAVA